MTRDRFPFDQDPANGRGPGWAAGKDASRPDRRKDPATDAGKARAAGKEGAPVSDDGPSDPASEDLDTAPSRKENRFASAELEPVPLSDDSLSSLDPVRLPIESILDLHSFRPEEIESVVEEYLNEALLAGFRQVRIIHGRGIGVQREIVRAVLARTAWVTSYEDARPEAGGWGATIAWIARGTVT